MIGSFGIFEGRRVGIINFNCLLLYHFIELQICYSRTQPCGVLRSQSSNYGTQSFEKRERRLSSGQRVKNISCFGQRIDIL